MVAGVLFAASEGACGKLYIDNKQLFVLRNCEYVALEERVANIVAIFFCSIKNEEEGLVFSLDVCFGTLVFFFFTLKGFIHCCLQ